LATTGTKVEPRWLKPFLETRISRVSLTLQLAESYLTGSLLCQILARIERLAWHPT
jgi:hypothetical protein